MNAVAVLLKFAVICEHWGELTPLVETVKLVGLLVTIAAAGTVAALVLLLLSDMLLMFRLGPLTVPPIVPPPLLTDADGGGPLRAAVPVTLAPATTCAADKVSDVILGAWTRNVPDTFWLDAIVIVVSEPTGRVPISKFAEFCPENGTANVASLSATFGLLLVKLTLKPLAGDGPLSST
jgi:hypothetical protein